MDRLLPDRSNGWMEGALHVFVDAGHNPAAGSRDFKLEPGGRYASREPSHMSV